jgi:hypothetical protein
MTAGEVAGIGDWQLASTLRKEIADQKTQRRALEDILRAAVESAETQVAQDLLLRTIESRAIHTGPTTDGTRIRRSLALASLMGATGFEDSVRLRLLSDANDTLDHIERPHLRAQAATNTSMAAIQAGFFDWARDRLCSIHGYDRIRADALAELTVRLAESSRYDDIPPVMNEVKYPAITDETWPKIVDVACQQGRFKEALYAAKQVEYNTREICKVAMEAAAGGDLEIAETCKTRTNLSSSTLFRESAPRDVELAIIEGIARAGEYESAIRRAEAFPPETGYRPGFEHRIRDEAFRNIALQAGTRGDFERAEHIAGMIASPVDRAKLYNELASSAHQAGKTETVHHLLIGALDTSVAIDFG